MSLSTRCQCCEHTPNSRAQEDCLAGCSCHARLPIHRAYGPTPVTRTPSKATGQVPPLVVGHARGVARHVPTARSRMGWFTTGWRR